MSIIRENGELLTGRDYTHTYFLTKIEILL